MIIDLTYAFTTLHHLWDAFGIILLGLIVVFVPLVVILASAIKIKEAKNHKQ